MNKIILFASFLLAVATSSNAQKTALKKVMELKMPKTVDDDMCGTRGASVAWHPVQQKYYAVFAGNMGYPLAVFDVKGKRLSDEELTAQVDTRGIWYNPVTKLICGNAYDENGWFNYKLDKKGLVSDYVTTIEGMNQPDAQSVGTYNSANKMVVFLKGGQVYTYNKDGMAMDSMAIHWGRKKADGPDEYEDIYTSPEDYNYTSVIYTGIKGQELGFLNTTNKEVELYDMKTGYRTRILSLPENATVESAFNFAMANGMYWLFNIEDRKWVAYK